MQGFGTLNILISVLNLFIAIRLFKYQLSSIRQTIRYANVNSLWTQDPVYFFDHLLWVRHWAITTLIKIAQELYQECLYLWRHQIHHFWMSFLLYPSHQLGNLFTFERRVSAPSVFILHLFDYDLWYINISYVLIAIVVHFFAEL